jgi:hypothetical protein
MELDEKISEAVEHASESRLNSVVAVVVALTATFMAIAGVKDGNIGQAMARAQARAVDSWSHYQAKSTKQSLAEATLAQIKALQTINPEQREALAPLSAQYNDEVKRYDHEKDEIKAEAEGYERTYDDLNLRDDQFDLSDAALSVSIALCGVTALTRKRWLLVIALLFIAVGVFFGMAGFLGLSVHPDALMQWLS